MMSMRLICCGALALLLCGALGAQTFTFATLAGSPGSSGHVDATGREARFVSPTALALDAAGNLYVADNNGSTIRKVTPRGVVTTFASNATVGSGPSVVFGNPQGIAVDLAGNVYVAEASFNTIRKISPAGVVTLLAGQRTQFPGPAVDGIGEAARFNGPRGLALDAGGNLYVADYYNALIRKITPAGAVTTYAGTRGSEGSTDGPAAGARFKRPNGLAFDATGALYVADTENHTIRKISSDGEVTTVAGLAGMPGSTDGVGAQARFNSPWGLAFDRAGDLYIADSFNSTIRRMTPAGVVTTISGAAGVTGSADGPGPSARFDRPLGLAFAQDGTLYVAESYNNFIIRAGFPAGADTIPFVLAPPINQTTTPGQPAIFTVGMGGTPAPALQWQRSANGGATWSNLADDAVFSGVTTASLRVSDTTLAMHGHVFRAVATTPLGVTATDPVALLVNTAFVFSTLAGKAGETGSTDGTGDAARFTTMGGVALDPAGNIYVTDLATHVIRKITQAGVVTTWAGAPGSAGSADGNGRAARFDHPHGLAADSAGNLYVADRGNHTIRRIAPDATVTTLAGTAGSFGFVDGVGAAARFHSPSGIAVDARGTLYVADANNDRVRKITADRSVSVLAGDPNGLSEADGTGMNAHFHDLIDVAVDAGFNVYVLETGQIRKILPSGLVTRIAGSSGSGGNIDGPGARARFGFALGLAVDRTGNLFVTGSLEQTIRRLTPAGFMTTVGGTYANGEVRRGSVDGLGTNALFRNAGRMAIDAAGTLYIADTGNSTLRVGRLAGDATLPVIVTQPIDQVLTIGKPATFSVGVTGVPLPDCRWQRSADGGASWADVRDEGIFSGAATGLLTLSMTTLATNTHQFRCIVTNARGSVVSRAASLTLRAPAGRHEVTTFAGVGGYHGAADGLHAHFWRPEGIALDAAGVIYVADTANHTLRRITAAGGVETYAGRAGVLGYADGPVSSARFAAPRHLAFDRAGNLYVTEATMVRRITPGGMVTTLAGAPGDANAVDGVGAAARFQGLAGIAVDSAGNVFVADSAVATLRKITPAGVVTTFAGAHRNFGFADGVGGAARFRSPFGLAFDAADNLYVTDPVNAAIRKITRDGAVTTLVGGSFGSIDGPLAIARFSTPGGIASDAFGNLVVMDATAQTLRRLSADGVVTTIAGNPGVRGTADGMGSAAEFFNATGVALHPSGRIFVADTGNHAVRVATPGPAPESSRLVNLSVRTVAGAGAQSLIAGFVVAGSGKRVLVRAAGPALLPFGVGGAMPNPQLALFSDGVQIAGNDDWGAAPNAAQIGVMAAQVGAFGFDTSSKDSALLVAVGAGPASARIADVGGGSGVALAELYDTEPDLAARVINLSARCQVEVGEGVLIAGFVVNGLGPKTVLIRAAGPALAGFGVTGLLADPLVRVYAGSVQLAANDNWVAGDAAGIVSATARVGAFAFQPGSRDAALQITLLPGAYTAQVSGVGNTRGIALVEIYEVP